MDYRKYAKDLLSRKNSLSTAYGVIKKELAGLEEERCSCKTMLLNQDKQSQHENGKNYDEMLVNLILRVEDCRLRLRVVERELMMIEQGMSSLTDYQQDLLDGFFVNRHTGVCEELMEKHFRERSGIYRDRTRALDEFTRSIYGVLQL